MDEVIQEYLQDTADSAGGAARGAGASLSSLEARQADLVLSYFTRIKTGVPNLSLSDDDLLAMAQTSISAFLENDLLMATRLLHDESQRVPLALCVMCSVDAHRQMVIAARGQTMSVAFYPETGLLLYASEQAAVKAALGITPDKHKMQNKNHRPRPRADAIKFTRDSRSPDPETSIDLEASASSASMSSVVDHGSAMRLDLDDLGGEVCLLDWGTGMPSACKSLRASAAQCGDAVRFHMCSFFHTCYLFDFFLSSDSISFRVLICQGRFAPQPMMNSLVTVTSIPETPLCPAELVPIEDNEIVFPLPKGQRV